MLLPPPLSHHAAAAAPPFEPAAGGGLTQAHALGAAEVAPPDGDARLAAEGRRCHAHLPLLVVCRVSFIGRGNGQQQNHIRQARCPRGSVDGSASLFLLPRGPADCGCRCIAKEEEKRNSRAPSSARPLAADLPSTPPVCALPGAWRRVVDGRDQCRATRRSKEIMSP